MTDIRILQELDREVSHYTGAILVARNEAESDLYRSCLSVAQRILTRVRDCDRTAEDETNYATAQVIARLDKAYNRTKEPYIRDQIRLAIRQLRRLIEPQNIDNEPIDIFNI